MSWHRKLPNQAACSNCCGIKEKLQTLWDRTINSILRINQVEPDDQGNIRIRSDNEALTITEGTNEIVLNLDTSELPAASVVSVNGETGAVQLSGDDIPSLYNGTVNSNIAGLWSTKAQRTDLNTEITNRQNADTALQNNINTLQASIPQEAADAVAADPTVQSFAAAAANIPNKVDKRTGSGLRAYTHDGSTQDDTVIEDSTNGATIPIRDANGRLHAADPASGATDKTLTTANWVSQTGAGKPNNLLHDGGNEDINGIKNVLGRINGLSNINNGRLYAYHSAGNYWRKKINILQDTSWCGMFIIKSVMIRGTNGPAIFVYQRRAGTSDFLQWIYKPAGVTMQVGVRDDGIYVFQNGSDGLSIELLGEIASQTNAANIIRISDDSVTEDTTFRVTI